MTRGTRTHRAIATLAVALNLTTCGTGGVGSTDASPRPAPVAPLHTPRGAPTVQASPGRDPNPQAYAAMPITAECAWLGLRWFSMLVLVNAHETVWLPEMRYAETGRLQVRTKTFEAHPGDIVTLTCAPLDVDHTDGYARCKLKWFNTVLQPDGQKEVRAGVVNCSASLPMRG